jgi:hypothetical protein
MASWPAGGSKEIRDRGAENKNKLAGFSKSSEMAD